MLWCEFNATGVAVNEVYYCENDPFLPLTHRYAKDGPARITRYDDGMLKAVNYMEFGVFHRPAEDGPAQILYSVTGEVVHVAYYFRGVAHRPTVDGPQSSYYEKDGSRVDIYKEMGARTRPWQAGPAFVKRTPTGAVEREIYHLNDRVHRPTEEGPAAVVFAGGLLKAVEYIICDHLHRPGDQGPASTSFHANGMVKMERYFINGTLTRAPEDGPACSYYDAEGRLTKSEYYVDGVLKSRRRVVWMCRRSLLRIFLAAWRKHQGRPPPGSCMNQVEALVRALHLRRFCRIRGGSLTSNHLVEPFGQAIVAFL